MVPVFITGSDVYDLTGQLVDTNAMAVTAQTFK
jgi:ribosomal protein S12 methylthiotransferase